MQRRPPAAHSRRSRVNVLIAGTDSVVAALLGALVELLGYVAHFAPTPVDLNDELRRLAPRVLLCDAARPELYAESMVGRAAMRGVGVVIYGSEAALEPLREMAREQRIETLRMPPAPGELEDVLLRAARDE